MSIKQHTCQKGFTLIELMIAMMLGLLLMAGVIELFLGSKQTYGVVAAQSHAQESGRFGLVFVSRSLRHAGYWGTVGVNKSFAIHQEFPEVNAIVFGRNNDATDAAVLDDTDDLFVRMTGSADGSIETCFGSALLDTQVAIDHYYIGVVTGSENIPSLYCSSRLYDFDTVSLAISDTVPPTAAVTQPLVNGIENMQILYGIGSLGEVTQYVNADGVTNWRDVRSVKVALLSASNENASGISNDRTYVLLDESVTAPGDARPRMVFQQTVSLRNFINSNE